MKSSNIDRLKSLILLSSLVLLAPVASWAAPNTLPTTQLLPVVDGPPETRSTPFIAWFMDLGEVGYVEEEYSVSGAANIYGYVDDAAQSAEVEVIMPDTAYNTRILVRQPVDPARFNGTVYLEVLNATAGWDGDPIWQSNFEYLTREGAAWVGMSTKPVTVDFLRERWITFIDRNASRYEDLAMPYFGQVWDMMSQTGALLKTPGAEGNPLAGLNVERIIMVGYSQSAAYQVTFANSFHAAATMPSGEPIMDGYFISAGGDNAKHVTGPTDSTPESLENGDARNLLSPTVPTIRFQTQTEVVGFPSYTVRQDENDEPMLRFYEMAGGSHVDAAINAVGGQALVRDLGFPPSFCPAPEFDYNPIIIGNVQSALMDRLDQWIADGTAPPASSFMDLDMTGEDVSVVLDADGNALGGIRPPTLQVPLGAYLPSNIGPGFCGLFGGFDKFSNEQLAERYSNHGEYVRSVTRAAESSLDEGFLLTEEAAALIGRAIDSSVGKELCNGQVVTVFLSAGQSPTEGDDVILGTPGDDIIDGLNGNDTICGKAGNDTIYGRAGTDLLIGGTGDDALYGGSGDDELQGGEGADMLIGNAGNDLLAGGASDDLLNGDSGDDVLQGGAGNDRLFGGSYDDQLNGGDGYDELNGGFGNDECAGGPMRDIAYYCEVKTDIP